MGCTASNYDEAAYDQQMEAMYDQRVASVPMSTARDTAVPAVIQVEEEPIGPPVDLSGRIRGSPPFTFREEEIEFRGLSPSFAPMGNGEMATLFRKAFPADSLPQSLVALEMTINVGFDPIGGGTYKTEGQDDCEIAILPAENGAVDGDVIFGLFDGHGQGGTAVSHFCTARYGGILIENEYYFTDPERALQETTIQLHQEMIQEGLQVEMAGTTAVIGLLRDLTLYVGNVGDSRAVMGTRRKSNPNHVLALSKDHKASDPAEMKRIEASGGRCEPMKDGSGNFVGPKRVYLLNEERPGLGMSRSLGDTLAHSVGVSAEAEVTTTKITSHDDFFVVGSDGLWDVIESEEVVRLVAEKIRWNRNHPGEAVLISEYLALEAQKRWREMVMREDNVVDDISVIICVFASPGVKYVAAAPLQVGMKSLQLDNTPAPPNSQSPEANPRFSSQIPHAGEPPPPPPPQRLQQYVPPAPQRNDNTMRGSPQGSRRGSPKRNGTPPMMGSAPPPPPQGDAWGTPPGPPRNQRGPPPGNQRGPPPGNQRAPPPGNQRAPPPGNQRAPPPGNRGPPQGQRTPPGNQRGPPPGNQRGPPQGGQRTPPRNQGGPRGPRGPPQSQRGSPPRNQGDPRGPRGPPRNQGGPRGPPRGPPQGGQRGPPPRSQRGPQQGGQRGPRGPQRANRGGYGGVPGSSNKPLNRNQPPRGNPGKGPPRGPALGGGMRGAPLAGPERGMSPKNTMSPKGTGKFSKGKPGTLKGVRPRDQMNDDGQDDFRISAFI